MVKVPPIMLRVRTREVLKPEDGEPRQIVEVLKGDQVLGQLPVTRAAYEMLPAELGKVTIEIITERAQIESHDVG